MGVSPTVEHQDGYLNSKVGMLVKINRGGPESFDGVLVSVQSGYVVMRTKAGLVYVQCKTILRAQLIFLVKKADVRLPTTLS